MRRVLSNKYQRNPLCVVSDKPTNEMYDSITVFLRQARPDSMPGNGVLSLAIPIDVSQLDSHGITTRVGDYSANFRVPSSSAGPV